MKLSLLRLNTQRHEQHEAVSVTMVDGAGEFYRQAVLIPRGADAATIYDALEHLGGFLVAYENGIKEGAFVIGQSTLTGHELNRDEYPDAEPSPSDYDRYVYVDRQQVVVVDGIRFSGHALAAIAAGGRTLAFKRAGDVLEVEDLTAREGDA